MKTRHSFVSNSSTSSYVMLVKEDIWKERLLTLSVEDRLAIQAISWDIKKLGTENYAFISYIYGDQDSFIYSGYQEEANELAKKEGLDPKDMEYNIYKALSSLRTEIINNADLATYFFHREEV